MGKIPFGMSSGWEDGRTTKKAIEAWVKGIGAGPLIRGHLQKTKGKDGLGQRELGNSTQRWRKFRIGDQGGGCG